MASKKVACIDTSICVACGACTKKCPRQALSVWRGCYAIVNKDNCVGCGMCAKTCPAGCIDIKNREATGIENDKGKIIDNGKIMDKDKDRIIDNDKIISKDKIINKEKARL